MSRNLEAKLVRLANLVQFPPHHSISTARILRLYRFFRSTESNKCYLVNLAREE